MKLATSIARLAYAAGEMSAVKRIEDAQQVYKALQGEK